MAPVLVVRNTFICAVEAEALSPPPMRRLRRTQTAPNRPQAFRWGEEALQLLALEAGTPEPTQAQRASDATAEAHDLARPKAENEDDSTEDGEESPQEDDSAAEEDGGVVALAAAAAVLGGVRDAVWSSGAAQVAAVVRRSCPVAAALVAGELLGEGWRLASHAQGYVVLCALMARAAAQPQTRSLVDEALAGGDGGVGALCCHKVGHKVVIAALTHGLEAQRAAIMSALCDEVQRFARHRYASRILEAALAGADAEARRQISTELLRRPGRLPSVACQCFGTHVVAALLKEPGEVANQTAAILQGAERRMMKDRYGAKLLARLHGGRQEGGAQTDSRRLLLVGAC